MRILRAVLLIAAVLGAQEKKTVTITGQVVDAVTGMPIARAVVRFQTGRPNEDQTVFTDAGGAFQLSDVSRGFLNVNVSKSYYLSGGLDGLKNAQKDIAEGRSVRIELKPFARVKGRIVDGEGNAVAGAKVELWHRTVEAGMPFLKLFHWMRADDQGEFGSSIWQPGRYEVRVSGRFGGTQVMIGDAVPPTDAQYAFAPLVEALELEYGKTSQLDLRVQSQPPTKILGALRGARTYERVQLAAYDANGVELSVLARVNTATGTFLLEGVPPGEWILRASQKADGQTLWGEQRVQVAGGVLRGVNLSLLPMDEIKVEVQCLAGLEPPNGRDLARVGDCDTEVMLFPTTRTVPDSVFIGRDKLQVPPGTYRVEVKQFRYTTRSTKSVSWGDQPLGAANTITLQAGVPVPPLRIELENLKALLQVKLKSNGSKPDDQRKALMIVLIPKFKSYQVAFEQMVYGNAAGGMAFSSLEAGQYDIYGWVKGEALLEYRNPEALSKATRLGVAEVKPGMTTVVDLEMP